MLYTSEDCLGFVSTAPVAPLITKASTGVDDVFLIQFTAAKLFVPFIAISVRYKFQVDPLTGSIFNTLAVPIKPVAPLYSEED